MTVLDRTELEASPLADLHAIADQLGLEGFRRLRKADLIAAILGDDRAEEGTERTERTDDSEPAEHGGSAAADTDANSGDEPASGARRRRRSPRARRSSSDTDSKRDGRTRTRARDDDTEDTDAIAPAGAGRTVAGGTRTAEGVVELLGNGSAFLRVNPPDASDEDVYISAAQVRRCELVSGDRVTGPLRTPRRSERYPSLVRVETINGVPAGDVSEGVRYEERPVAYPSERFELDAGEPTLNAIEWLAPFGKGSRVVIAGPARAGKTEVLRALFSKLTAREGLEVTLVLAGVRPEEIADWGDGSAVAPAVALSFAASADAQSQAVERAIETATRTAARGGDALVLIDTLDGLHPHAARKILAAARNLRDGGSLTILATATRPFGGETTVIALDPVLAAAGGPPLDLTASGTVRSELLVGADGAAAIAQARQAALTQA